MTNKVSIMEEGGTFIVLSSRETWLGTCLSRNEYRDRATAQKRYQRLLNRGYKPVNMKIVIEDEIILTGQPK